MTKRKQSKHDRFITDIIAYESGTMKKRDEGAFLKSNRGTLSHLQGHYGRKFAQMDKKEKLFNF